MVVHHSTPVAEVVTALDLPMTFGSITSYARPLRLQNSTASFDEKPTLSWTAESACAEGTHAWRQRPGQHRQPRLGAAPKSTQQQPRRQHSRRQLARTISGFFHLPALLEALSYSSFHTFRSFTLGRAKCVLRGAGMNLDPPRLVLLRQAQLPPACCAARGWRRPYEPHHALRREL